MNQNPKKYGLSKSEIIRRPQDISLIFESGRSLRGRSFDLIYVTDSSRQVLFAVSKRVRNATTRNCIKRRLREAYRLKKNDFPENVRLVLIGREKVLQAPLASLCDEMRIMAAKIAQPSASRQV